jgi:integrase
VWAVRAFLYQVRAFEPETEIPPNIFRVGRRRRRPYVFSDEELGRLLQAPHQLRAVDARHRPTLVTLMGLLASTGPRIGEAFRLTFDEMRRVGVELGRIVLGLGEIELPGSDPRILRLRRHGNRDGEDRRERE